MGEKVRIFDKQDRSSLPSSSSSSSISDFSTISSTSSKNHYPISIQQHAFKTDDNSFDATATMNNYTTSNNSPNMENTSPSTSSTSSLNEENEHILDFVRKFSQIILRARCSVNARLPCSIDLQTLSEKVDFWRNGLPINIDVFVATGRKSLLERWAISYEASVHHHHHHHLDESSPSNANHHPHDLTNLMLLAQSLYSHIRLMPLHSLLSEGTLKTTDLECCISTADGYSLTLPDNLQSPSATSPFSLSGTSPSRTYYLGNANDDDDSPTSPTTIGSSGFDLSAKLKVYKFKIASTSFGKLHLSVVYDSNIRKDSTPKTSPIKQTTSVVSSVTSAVTTTSPTTITSSSSMSSAFLPAPPSLPHHTQQDKAPSSPSPPPLPRIDHRPSTPPSQTVEASSISSSSSATNIRSMPFEAPAIRRFQNSSSPFPSPKMQRKVLGIANLKLRMGAASGKQASPNLDETEAPESEPHLSDDSIINKELSSSPSFQSVRRNLLLFSGVSDEFKSALRTTSSNPSSTNANATLTPSPLSAMSNTPTTPVAMPAPTKTVWRWRESGVEFGFGKGKQNVGSSSGTSQTESMTEDSETDDLILEALKNERIEDLEEPFPLILEDGKVMVDDEQMTRVSSRKPPRPPLLTRALFTTPPTNTPTTPSLDPITIPSPSASSFRSYSSFQEQSSTSKHRWREFRRRNSVGAATSLELFGSLVGSYEESILSGRMSTLPSKPIGFIAEIGVVGFGKCRSALKCPPHMNIPFPAYFYELLDDQNPATPYVGWIHIDEANDTVNGNESRSRAGSTSDGDAEIGNSSSTVGHKEKPSLSDVSSTSSESLVKTPSMKKQFWGYRLPMKGQLQIIIKNPSKTAVKVFLIPYDFRDMPPSTKTFLRQKSYSVPTSDKARPHLRYAIHLQFVSPSRKKLYLSKAIRVVFSHRSPDSDEKLKVTCEGPTSPKYVPLDLATYFGNNHRDREGVLSDDEFLESNYVFGTFGASDDGNSQRGDVITKDSLLFRSSRRRNSFGQLEQLGVNLSNLSVSPIRRLKTPREASSSSVNTTTTPVPFTRDIITSSSPPTSSSTSFQNHHGLFPSKTRPMHWHFRSVASTTSSITVTSTSATMSPPNSNSSEIKLDTLEPRRAKQPINDRTSFSR